MSTKIYKISVYEKTYKYVKKEDKFKEYKSFHINDCSFGLLDEYSSREAAQEAIEKKVAPNKWCPNVIYEKITETTYKLRFKDSDKIYRIVSFCICEFEDIEEQ
jgi:hypothetical protein